MTRTSSSQRSLLTWALAAAAGAALTLIVGTLLLRTGPSVDRKGTVVGCQCEDADRTASEEVSQRLAQQVEQNGELRRALLAALARTPECDELSEQAEEPLAAEPVLEQEPQTLSPEEIAAQEKAEVVSLGSELSQEPVDPVWAPDTEQATAHAISAIESMHLEDVRCGESLCRVRVTHRDPARRDDDVELLLGTTPGGGQARVYAPSNDRTTVMFFSRKGMQLSVFAPPLPSIPSPPVD